MKQSDSPKPDSPPPRWNGWTLGVIFLSLAWLAFLYARTPLTPISGGRDLYDGLHYAAMAETPFEANPMTRLQPFCWRVLSPWLVGAFSDNVVQGFLTLSFLGQWLAAVLLWALLRGLNVSPLLSAFGVALHLTSFWGPQYAFWSPCHPETMNMVMLLALLITITRGKPWLTAVLTILAAMQREQLLTLALFQWLWLWTRQGKRPLPAFGLSALIFLPGALTLLALYLAIEPINPRGALETIGFYSRQKWEHLESSNGIYGLRFLVGSLVALGVVPWLILLGGPRLWRGLRADAPWLVMALVTWIFVVIAGTDCERRVYVAFPLLLAPLLTRWGDSSLAARTVPLILWALVIQLVMSLTLVDLSSPDQMVNTTLAIFMPNEEFWSHTIKMSLVTVTFLAGAVVIRQARR
jgi:hypothetical protein